VLIMEDEPAVRDLAARVLTRQGYSVIQAANGVEAVARFDERPEQIDLVLRMLFRQ